MFRRTILLTTLAASIASAQANIPQFRGDIGILAGTLPPAGIYAGGLFNSYRADGVIGANGTEFPNLQPVVNTAALLIEYSSQYKILGGRLTAKAYMPFADFALATPNVEADGGWGPGDFYVQPIRIGWTLQYADVTAGVAAFAPTGRFRDDALNNSGLGMWSFESSLGGTVFLYENRRGPNLSTVASYQVQSRVMGTDKRPGNVLTLEGGAGYAILQGKGQVGLAYYARWKVTSDDRFQFPAQFAGRDRVFGVGPEFYVPIFNNPFRALATVRFFVEAGNRVATEGNSLYVILTAFKPPRVP
jgi:hypothetical protein